MTPTSPLTRDVKSISEGFGAFGTVGIRDHGCKNSSVDDARRADGWNMLRLMRCHRKPLRLISTAAAIAHIDEMPQLPMDRARSHSILHQGVSAPLWRYYEQEGYMFGSRQIPEPASRLMRGS
jgi:hypothetical protein